MMEGLQQGLAAYGKLDPAGWLALHALLPAWVGAVVASLGGALLLVGTGHLFRLVSTPLGAAMGFFLAPGVAERLQPGWPAATVAWGACAVLALVGLLFPAGLAFVAAGVPAGFLGMRYVTPEEWVMGFAPAFFIAGTVAALAERMLAGVLASFTGAWLLLLGALAFLPALGVPVKAALAQPWGLVALAGLLGAAGTYYQVAVKPPPEEAKKLKEEKTAKKQREKEDQELERKFEKFTRGGKQR
ncbi:MAG: hypothetical protein FJ086_09065 [Deltaproteobacteria bacterium]|nr:hypothetical protein [Deltaproteobacteria bacterium]